MIVNTDITIFNRKANPETRKMEYCRTILYGVHWYTDQKTAVTDHGLKSGDIYKIRIPMKNREGYIPPVEYAVLPWEKRQDYWTVENGDLFVKGVVNTGITKLSELYAQHHEIGQVYSYSDNRFGLNPHIRIGGGAGNANKN